MRGDEEDEEESEDAVSSTDRPSEDDSLAHKRAPDVITHFTIPI